MAQRTFWITSGLLSLLTITGNLCGAQAITCLEPTITSVLLRTKNVFVGAFSALLLGSQGEPLTRALGNRGGTGARWPCWSCASRCRSRGSGAGALWALGGAASFGLMQVRQCSLGRRPAHQCPLVPPFPDDLPAGHLEGSGRHFGSARSRRTDNVVSPAGHYGIAEHSAPAALTRQVAPSSLQSMSISWRARPPRLPSQRSSRSPEHSPASSTFPHGSHQSLACSRNASVAAPKVA